MSISVRDVRYGYHPCLPLFHSAIIYICIHFLFTLFLILVELSSRVSPRPDIFINNY